MPTMVQKDIDVGVAEPDKTYFFTPVSGDAALDMNDYKFVETVVIVTSTIAGTITLPNVAEAKGLQFTFVMRTRGSSYDVVLYDRDDSEDWTDITFNLANDTFTCRSDGLRWVTVHSSGV